MIDTVVELRRVWCFERLTPTFLASPSTLNLIDNPELINPSIKSSIKYLANYTIHQLTHHSVKRLIKNSFTNTSSTNLH